MRPANEFIDKWGLLDKIYKPDGGDTCHREGMFFALLGMAKEKECMQILPTQQRYDVVMRKLHVTDGVFIRHSNTEYDASDWDRMSRDQLQPMIIAAGYWGKENELQRINRGHRRRAYLFASNTRKNGATKENHGKEHAGEVRDYSWKFPDVTAFEIWGNFIRAFKAWYLYPILLLCDLELLGGAIKWRFFPNHNIAMNHTLSQMQAMDIMPTPISWLASKVMKVPHLITLIEDHFNDFPDDMEFFGPMFRKAYNKINGSTLI